MKILNHHQFIMASTRIVPILIFFIAGCNSKLKVSPDIHLKPRLKNDEWILRAINYTYGYVDLRLSSKQTGTEIKKVVINPKDSLDLMTLGKGSKTELSSQFNEKLSFKYFLGGNPNLTSPNFDYQYLLPFRDGKWYCVLQGFEGSFSHNVPSSLYAIDFKMEIGEPVFAARNGKVIKVVSHFKRSGGLEMKDQANFIMILHPDGTTSSYVHLKHKGSVVTEGQFVKKGEHIGYSGNTGFSDTPHLHFVVKKEENQSIPFSFEGYEGIQLRKNQMYKRRAIESNSHTN